MKWISVKDQLPDFDDKEDHCNQYYVVYIHGYGFDRAMFMEGGWWKSYTAMICEPVTHWFLPDKPTSNPINPIE